MTDAKLLRAYRLTRYTAAGFDVRIGQPVPDALLTLLQARTAVFITAWNPLSRRMTFGWNHRMQRNLRARLRRFGVLDADGAFRQWHEAHLLVAGDTRVLLRLAREFRQRAIVVIARGRKARLAFPSPLPQAGEVY